MGKLTLVSFVFFISTFSFAQEKIRKNELSISPIKVSSSHSSFYYFDLPLIPNLGVNMIYKRRIYNHFYFRASQSYYNYSLKDYGYYFYENGIKESKVQEINTSSGVEFRYFKTKSGKLVLHTGFDASFFIHNTTTPEHIRGDDIFDTDYTFNQTNTGFGIQAFSGLSIYPTKRIVLSLEGALLIGFYKVKTSYSDFNGSMQSTIEDKSWNPYSQFFLLRTASIGWRF